MGVCAVAVLLCYLFFLHTKLLALLINTLLHRVGGFNAENKCYLSFGRIHISLFAGKIVIHNFKYADEDNGVNIANVTIAIQYWKAPSEDEKRPRFRIMLTSMDVVMSNKSAAYASRAVQLHPHGGQPDFVRLPARTPHGGASYVW